MRSAGARRVGILGGSFDPVHAGHLAAAEEAAQALGLERVIMVPAGTPPHKPAGAFASAGDRLSMLLAAAAGRPLLEVSDVELRRPGCSYTVDTVRELGDRLGPGVELYLLLGTDAVRELPSWKDVRGLFERARPAVIHRPGDAPVDWQGLARALPPGLGERLQSSILRLQRGVEVSSTEIRRRVAAGEPVRGLLPPAVERYVREHGLYLRSGPAARRCSSGAHSGDG